MPIVALRPGESVDVNFTDTDGIITVSFCVARTGSIIVHSDLPDNTGREGMIYCERINYPKKDKRKKKTKAKFKDNPLNRDASKV